MGSSLSRGPLPMTLGWVSRPEAGTWVGLHIASRHPCTFSPQALMAEWRLPGCPGQRKTAVEMEWECCQGVFWFFRNAQGTI